MKITVELIQDLKNELQPKDIKVVNGKGVFTINDIKKYIESVSRLSRSFEFTGSKKILSHYANKKINPKFYGKADGRNTSKHLTKKEFQNGEAGYVWVKFKNGKIELK